jgi:trk system potassium uptake protein TrkH
MVDEARRDDEDGAPSRRAAPRSAWTSRLSERVLDRLGLAGLLAVGAAVCAADFFTAGQPVLSIVFTSLECLVALPWARLIFRLGRSERRLEVGERKRRLWMLSAHGLTVTLVVATLVAKAFVVLKIYRGDSEDLTGPYQTYLITFYVTFALGLVGRGSRAGRFLAAVAEQPARLMTLSFGSVALIGAFVLTMPISVREVAKTSFVEALFTATGAVCGGLGVNDVASTYDPFGQFVVLVLIQVGGLGIMVLSAFFAIAAGRRLRAKSSAVMAEMIDVESMDSMRRMVRSIVLFTLTFEALGAVALWFAMARNPSVALGYEMPDSAAGAGSLAWSAVFHSVSAFCNAGFSLCHGNLVPFVGDWPVSLTICALVTLGGIGFPVLAELVSAARTRLAGRRPPRLSLNSRVSMASCAILSLGGAAGFLVLEWDRSLGGAPAGTKVLASVFQSVSARTAGFNSVDVAKLGAPALLFVSFLMFVGTSSGSTGGGVKTSTLAVLWATFRAERRGGEKPHLFDRRIPLATARKAVAVITVSGVLVFAAFFVLLVTEEADSLKLWFEVVSAFATCGLSAGVTAGLSVTGKLVIVATMLAGRVGPLTLALAAAAPPRRVRTELAEERLPIG